jgi:membrane protein implicated in regulation of membrane protease activity
VQTLVAGVLALLVVLVVVWRLWRVLNGDEPPEPGGSYGRQLFGRYRDLEKPQPEDNGP